MLIKSFFLDLNNVGEDYNAFESRLSDVFNNVVEKILFHYSIQDKRADFELLIEEYRLITSSNPLHHYPSFWKHITEKILNRNLSFDEIEILYNFYLSEYEKAIQIFDDYIPLIDRGIKKDIKIGVIANGNDKRIYRFLNKFDLIDKLSTIIPSGSNPFKKPDIEIFRLGLKNLNTKFLHSIFIGDRIDTDIIGANKAGIWSILLLRNENYEKNGTDDNSKPDFTIKNLNEVWNLPIIQIKKEIDSVVIPCGGRGLRMGDLTENNQKCLLNIKNIPILLRIVLKMKSAGIINFYFLTKYKDDLVKDFFGDGSNYGINANYISNNFNSTGKGVWSNLDKLPNRFFYSHGNILLSNSSASIIYKQAYLNPEKSIFLITKKPIAPTHPIFNFDNNKLVNISRHLQINNSNYEAYFSVGFSYINKQDLKMIGIIDNEMTTEQLFNDVNDLKTIICNEAWYHLETKVDFENFNNSIDNEYI